MCLLKKKKVLLLIVLVSTILVHTAKADPILPSDKDAGVIDKANVNNIQNIIQNKKTPKVELDLKPQNPKNNSQNNTKIQIHKLIFEGNTVYKTDFLEKYTQEIIGKEITITELLQTVNKITDLYQNNGYITSMAYIPPQQLQNGIVEVKIFEGKIGNIKLEGNKWTKTSYIKKHLLEENNLSQNKILNVNNIRSSLSDINGTHYLTGQIALNKGELPQTTDINLEINEKLPFGLSSSWDNTGRDIVGVQKANIIANIYNLTGYGDNIYGSTSLASRTVSAGAEYSIPIGNKGTNLKFDYSFSKIKLGNPYKSSDIEGVSHSFVPSISQSIYNGKHLKLSGNIALDMRTSITTMKKTAIMDKYELRILRTGFNANYDDNSGRWIADTTFSTGLPLLGADTNSIKLKRTFFKANSSIYRIQRLPYNFVGIGRSSFQIAGSSLKSVEQYQLGGIYTVRGYNEGVLLGDDGINTSIEVRHTIPLLPETISLKYAKNKKYKIGVKNNIQLAGFYDQGWSHDVKKTNSTSPHSFIQSVGVGLRVNLFKNLTANLDLGIPLGAKKFQDQKSAVFHFSISTDILDGAKDLFKKDERL